MNIELFKQFRKNKVYCPDCNTNIQKTLDYNDGFCSCNNLYYSCENIKSFPSYDFSLDNKKYEFIYSFDSNDTALFIIENEDIVSSLTTAFHPFNKSKKQILKFIQSVTLL